MKRPSQPFALGGRAIVAPRARISPTAATLIKIHHYLDRHRPSGALLMGGRLAAATARREIAIANDRSAKATAEWKRTHYDTVAQELESALTAWEVSPWA